MLIKPLFSYMSLDFISFIQKKVLKNNVEYCLGEIYNATLDPMSDKIVFDVTLPEKTRVSFDRDGKNLMNAYMLQPRKNLESPFDMDWFYQQVNENKDTGRIPLADKHHPWRWAAGGGILAIKSKPDDDYYTHLILPRRDKYAPTYKEWLTGTTGPSESIEDFFDPSRIHKHEIAEELNFIDKNGQLHPYDFGDKSAEKWQAFAKERAEISALKFEGCGTPIELKRLDVPGNSIINVYRNDNKTAPISTTESILVIDPATRGIDTIGVYAIENITLEDISSEEITPVDTEIFFDKNKKPQPTNRDVCILPIEKLTEENSLLELIRYNYKNNVFGDALNLPKEKVTPVARAAINAITGKEIYTNSEYDVLKEVPKIHRVFF